MLLTKKALLKWLATIYRYFGKIDILVNNAGIFIDTLVADKTVKDFRRILDVNLIGTFFSVKISSRSHA